MKKNKNLSLRNFKNVLSIVNHLIWIGVVKKFQVFFFFFFLFGILIFHVPIKTAANTFSLFSEKIRLDISCESSARQMIHMKHQALFSLKDIAMKT